MANASDGPQRLTCADAPVEGPEQAPTNEDAVAEGTSEEESTDDTGASPSDVPTDATVVRFIKTPFHIDTKRSRLKPGAFQPPPGSDEVSVVQQAHAGDDYCKQMAVEKVREDEYYGLAPGVVGAVLEAGAKAVLDTPHVFAGHADIIAPYVKPLDEPLTPEQTHEMQNFLRAMVSHFVYYPDPDKESPDWKGPNLARAS